jgi:hypothetical protein
MTNMHTLVQQGKTLCIGAAGVAGINVTPELMAVVPSDVSSIVGVVTQLVVAVSTLIALFKKKKRTNRP